MKNYRLVTVSNMPDTFPYVNTQTLRTYFQIGKFGEATLRQKLPSPIYWIQPERKILWNLTLIRDYLIHGDTPEHQRLIERYLKTFPSA